MEAKGLMMLKVLINRYNPKAGNALIKLLPPDEMQGVSNQEIDSTDLLPLLNQPQNVIENMHYSWIQPVLKKFPPVMQSLIIGALHPKQAARLLKDLPIEASTPSAPVKAFVLHQLYTQFESEVPMPLEYLPETDLTLLAKWSKKELVKLIDFLGLHDLASEMRRIVNKTYLENFYSCLSPQQLYYLRICLQQKERLASPKLGLNPAVKDCEKLKLALHQRGLVRLGKALSGQHPNLVWYITRILDVGRGKILLHYYQKQPIPQITPILKLQVVNVINFIKKSKT